MRNFDQKQEIQLDSYMIKLETCKSIYTMLNNLNISQFKFISSCLISCVPCLTAILPSFLKTQLIYPFLPEYLGLWCSLPGDFRSKKRWVTPKWDAKVEQDWNYCEFWSHLTAVDRVYKWKNHINDKALPIWIRFWHFYQIKKLFEVWTILNRV